MKTEVSDEHYLICGKKYVRVSRLLQAVGVSDFSHIPDRHRKFAMDRGTANHDLWAKVEQGIDHQFTFDTRVEKYRVAHTAFLRDTGFLAYVHGIETIVRAPWSLFGLVDGPDADGNEGVAGTFDRFGEMQGRDVLLDFKSGTIPDSTRLQTAYYALMLPHFDFPDIDRYGVALHPDGTYSMSQKYPYSDKEEAIALVHRYRKEKS